MFPQNSYQLPNGFNIYIIPPVPKMQLSLNVPVTSEFREEVNKWMISFFGYQPEILDGKVIMSVPDKAIYMTEVQFSELRKQFAESPKYSQWVNQWNVLHPEAVCGVVSVA